MAYEFRLPELGENIDAGEVVRVLVSPGDTVEEGQGVVEIESEKATAEVPIDRAGTVSGVNVGEGDSVKPGDVLLSLETETQENEADAEEDAEEAEEVEAVRADKAHKEEKQDAAKDKKNDTGRQLVEMKLPELGEGFESGEVVGIAVHEGDLIEEGQTVIEIETGKAVAEVPADLGGTVKTIHVEEGQSVQVGAKLVTVETTGKSAKKKKASKSSGGKPSSDKSAEPEDSGETEETEDKAPTTAQMIGAVMATPSVRRLARELGVEIHAVEGTGAGGRILEENVKHAARLMILTGHRDAKRVADHRGEGEPFDDFGPVSREKLTATRRAIAEKMSESWAAVPRVSHLARADWRAVTDARERLQKQAGTKVSFTAILAKVVGLALKRHPRFNATLDLSRRELVRRDYCNLGIAADTEKGLVVPVLRDVWSRSVIELSDNLADLAERARNGKLDRAAMQGATFTISNIGGLGGDWFTPIVNVPEVAILGVGRAKIEPVWNGKEFEPVPQCPLSLSYDHRAVDGADAARFLQWLVDALENPLLASLEGI